MFKVIIYSIDFKEMWGILKSRWAVDFKQRLKKVFKENKDKINSIFNKTKMRLITLHLLIFITFVIVWVIFSVLSPWVI